MMDVGVIGIDPGRSGGVAYFGIDYAAPLVLKMGQTPREIWDILRDLRDKAGIPVRVMVESVHSMSSDGSKSAFTFGKNNGHIEMALTGLDMSWEKVTPQKWQSAMQCMTHGDKSVSRARAQALWPAVKFTDATADAALIAEYARLLWLKVFS